MITLYFSPTGTTAAVCKAIAQGEAYDFTLPAARAGAPSYGPKDVVAVGVPVYSGRIPPVAAEYLKTVKGNGARAVAVAVYGNRDYDDALLELCDILEDAGFDVVGAGAFVGEHSLNETVAAGRPDAEDLKAAKTFGAAVSDKLARGELSRPAVKGVRPYKALGPGAGYAPQPTDACVKCGICETVCSMGVIHDLTADPEKCIRCFACVKRCPHGARAAAAEAYSNTRGWLAEKCAARREPEWFV
ncbi:MAG TPA: 4Fe-4S binding protein [Terriglobales bacterium]|nr:4Fe-4S binding protein [Terriglobales bacterium]